jgi:hypothetical protein
MIIANNRRIALSADMDGKKKTRTAKELEEPEVVPFLFQCG